MSLDERRKALEDEFFRTKDNENIEKLRAEASAREKLGSLRKVSGISDEKLLGKMIDLGISEETLCAIRLVPMVAVAWADDELHAKEREAILKGAKAYGVEKDSVAYELLNGWLDFKPPAGLLDAWSEYIATLKEHLSDEQIEIIKTQIVGRARDVAQSAGGFLGLATISEPEKKIIEQLESVLYTPDNLSPL